MFFYIGGILVWFEIGYLVAIYQNRDQTKNDGTCKRGINDCRNCKHMKIIENDGTVQCEKEFFRLSKVPRNCTCYKRIEDTGNED